MYFRIITIVLMFVFFVSGAGEVLAAKKLVRKASTATAKTVSYSTVKLNRATHSAVVTFMNLSKAKNVEYTLSYSANGIPQGAVGSFAPDGTNQSRDLYFGTCSKGVCTPHYGITGATLIVKTIFTSGASYTKRYRFSRV